MTAGETHPGAALQDILWLLTLCFNHGSAPDLDVDCKCQNHLLNFLSCCCAGETHPGAALQDILRLLTLWFNHGSAPDVEAALQEGFGRVSIDTWLVVIPQVCFKQNLHLESIADAVCVRDFDHIASVLLVVGINMHYSRFTDDSMTGCSPIDASRALYACCAFYMPVAVTSEQVHGGCRQSKHLVVLLQQLISY